MIKIRVDWQRLLQGLLRAARAALICLGPLVASYSEARTHRTNGVWQALAFALPCFRGQSCATSALRGAYRRPTRYLPAS